jgi:hypothetical protein
LSKYGTPVEEIEEEQKEEENDKPTGAVNVNDFIAEQAKKFSNLYK